MAKTKPLSERERRFVAAFCGEAAGNVTRAAELAGFSLRSARFQGSKLATRRNIKIAIEAYQAKLARPSIADAVERREVLTGLLRDESNGLVRIKALDVLNKMDGLYVQKHQHSGPDGGPIRTAPDAQIDQRIAELEQHLRR